MVVRLTEDLNVEHYWLEYHEHLQKREKVIETMHLEDKHIDAPYTFTQWLCSRMAEKEQELKDLKLIHKKMRIEADRKLRETKTSTSTSTKSSLDFNQIIDNNEWQRRAIKKSINRARSSPFPR